MGLKRAEQLEAANEEENEQASPAERLERARKRRTNRGPLPPHLPRVEMVVDIEDHACPCCRNGLHRIGKDVSERLRSTPGSGSISIAARSPTGSASRSQAAKSRPRLGSPMAAPAPDDQRVSLYTAEGLSHPALQGSWIAEGFHGTMAELLSAIAENREPENGARNNLESLKLCFAAIQSSHCRRRSKTADKRRQELKRWREQRRSPARSSTSAVAGDRLCGAVLII